MSIKDEIKYVKEELSSDEKLLESAFKIEKFYKKHKKKIYTILGVILALVIINWGYNSYIEYKLKKANSALLKLYQDPLNKDALETLKSQNKRLYDLWIYSLGVENQKKDRLELLLKENDELLKDISNYHIGVIEQNPKDSKYYHDLAMVEKAYLLLKANKKNQAKVILEQIPQNSPLSNIAKFLKHYTITANTAK